MRFIPVLLSFVILVGCGSEKPKESSGAQEFSFPAALSKPTELERRSAELVRKAADKAVEGQQGEIKGVISSMHKAEENLRAATEKDINRAAADVLKRLASAPADQDAQVSVYMFPQIIHTRISNIPKSEHKKTYQELRRFADQAIEILSKTATPGSETTLQVMQETGINASLKLGDDEYANKLAEKMLAENTGKAGWNFGNVVHDANRTLAEIAFRKGDIDEASKRLIEAGKSPGSPQLNSFGPTFPLVPKLWSKGRKEPVLEYLRGISKFYEPEKVKGWIKQLERGSLPTDREWVMSTRQ